MLKRHRAMDTPIWESIKVGNPHNLVPQPIEQQHPIIQYIGLRFEELPDYLGIARDTYIYIYGECLGVRSVSIDSVRSLKFFLACTNFHAPLALHSRSTQLHERIEYCAGLPGLLAQARAPVRSRGVSGALWASSDPSPSEALGPGPGPNGGPVLGCS